MDAVKFINAKNKMCNSYFCEDCPLYDASEGAEARCGTFINSYPEEAVAIVEKWLVDHPIKTMADDFFEKYPNAPRDEDAPGVPSICPTALGFPLPIKGCTETDCAECWGKGGRVSDRDTESCISASNGYRRFRKCCCRSGQ